MMRLWISLCESEKKAELAAPVVTKDWWRGKRALEWRFPLTRGEGGGPHGEAVRIVGIPQGQTLHVFYIVSYRRGEKLAEAALLFLRQRYQGLIAREARNVNFVQHMIDKGIFDQSRDD